MRVFLGILVCTLCGSEIPEPPAVNTSNFLPPVRAQIEHATAAARSRPRDPSAVGRMAMILHAYQLYDAAARAYSRARALDPQNFDWAYLGGASEMTQGRFNAAIQCFEIALRIRPGDLVTELRLADSLAALAKWDEARLHYQNILDKHADCPQAWYGLGRVQAAQGDHAAALRSYEKACQLFPSYGIAQFALAQELRLSGNKAAMQDHLALYSQDVTAEPPLDDPLFKRIRELNLGVQAHLQRGAELDRAGRLDEAILENEAALAADPRSEQAHINLISLYGRTGFAAKAKLHFQAAVALNPGRSDAWYNYGVLLFQAQDYVAAEKAFRQALEIDPDYAEAHAHLGAMYEQQGRLDDAAKEFQNAIAERPDYPLARFHLGRIWVNKQNYDQAIQQFLKALAPEDDQIAVYLYALAGTYARAGELSLAVAYLQKARDAAVAHGQTQMLKSIDRDLKALRENP